MIIIASASQLLALDESASLSDLISAATIGAGDSVSVGNKVHVIPEWLKIRLPMCVNPSRGLIDLSLPLSSNPFYLDMIERMGSSQMMTTLKGASNSRDHILLLGSSGKCVICFTFITGISVNLIFFYLQAVERRPPVLLWQPNTT